MRWILFCFIIIIPLISGFSFGFINWEGELLSYLNYCIIIIILMDPENYQLKAYSDIPVISKTEF